MAAAVCVLVALASLALPSGPTYDPYAWLIWGRDLAHLDLVTSGGGTSWKPLPALIDALLTPLGGIAAQGWLVVARAGALFAVYMAFRLAWRLAPRPQRALAGLCAAAALVVSHEWLRRNGVGDAEGLGTAFGLLAVDRHLDGKNGQAYGLIVAAALIRVEAWPFALGYGAWIWWRREHRLEVALLAAAIPVAWFGGDWLGSGSAATAANRALHPIPGSPGASAHPARAVVAEALTMLPPAAWVAIAAATVAALWTRSRASATTATWRLDAAPRRGIDSAVLWLCAAAAAWIAIVAAMAERGYPGLPRFLFMAVGVEAVVAGVGCAWIAHALSHPRWLRASAAVAAALVAVAFAAGSVNDARRLPADASAIDKVADMDARLVRSVRRAGGDAVLRCGAPDTPWYTVTALAWDLDVSPSQIDGTARSVRLTAPPCRADADSTRRG